MSKDDNSGKGGGHDDDITLTIATPKGAFTADFDKNAKVFDVIEAAIKHEKLNGAPSDFELLQGKEAVAPTERTLVSFHLKDGDQLVLAAREHGHPKVYHLVVNRQPKEWKSELILGSDIRGLSGSPDDWVVNQIVDGPGDDPEIAPDQHVHLAIEALPVGEKKFIVRKPKTAPGA